MVAMVAYAVEIYLPRTDADGFDELTRLAQRACRELRSGHERIRYLSALLLSDDETAFVLLESATPEAVRSLVERMGLRSERVHAAVVRGEKPA